MKLRCGAWLKQMLLSFCIALTSCQSRHGDTGPSIEFSKIPPAAQGGRERVDTIAGRVKNPRPGQSYHPPPTIEVAPTVGGSVALVRIVKGVGSLPPLPTRPLRFSGYDWEIHTSSQTRGGLNNLYDADNVWSDASGALHLRITKKSDKWTCAHVMLTRSLGYGTYTFVVRDTSHLEPAAILSMHTYDRWGGDQHFREMNIEIGRWGDATSKDNAQYSIQPFYVPGNISQFTEPGGTLTHTLLWESGRASFKTVRGSSMRPVAPMIHQHIFTSGVPTPGQELLELMLYIVASDRYPLQKDAEVVIEKFEYLP